MKMTTEELARIVTSMDLAHDNANRAKDRGDDKEFWYHKDIWEGLKKELDNAIKE